jgi:hypothetical protein
MNFAPGSSGGGSRDGPENDGSTFPYRGTLTLLADDVHAGA